MAMAQNVIAATTTSLMGNSSYSSEFTAQLIHTLRFFYAYEMPRMQGMATILKQKESLTLLQNKEVFA
ncbi:MAG: hypothetical protein R2795_12765 [Saprospiraceae bacterium]